MTDLTIRKAVLADVQAIIALLADDEFGHTREDMSVPLNQRYADAFAQIDADPNQFLAVAEQGGEVVGCFQLTFIANLSLIGMRRCLLGGGARPCRSSQQGAGPNHDKLGDFDETRRRKWRRYPVDQQQETPRRASVLRKPRLRR